MKMKKMLTVKGKRMSDEKIKTKVLKNAETRISMERIITKNIY